MQQVAQVRAGLGFGRVGPEEEGQPLPADGRVAVEQEIGEQALGARPAEPVQRRSVVKHAKPAQEPDLQSAH